MNNLQKNILSKSLINVLMLIFLLAASTPNEALSREDIFSRQLGEQGLVSFSGNFLTLNINFERLNRGWLESGTPSEYKSFLIRTERISKALALYGSGSGVSGTGGRFWKKISTESSQGKSLVDCMNFPNRCPEVSPKVLLYLKQKLEKLDKEHSFKGNVEDRLHFLEIFNGFINGYTYREDSDADIWRTPIEFLANKGGDCEDFALLKYAILTRYFQWDPDQMRLGWIIRTENNISTNATAHMILAISLEDEIWVLDNTVLGQDSRNITYNENRQIIGPLYKPDQYLKAGWQLIGYGNENESKFILPHPSITSDEPEAY